MNTNAFDRKTHEPREQNKSKTLSRILRSSRLHQRPLNPPDERRFILWLHGGPPQGVFPNPQHAPPCPAQRKRHENVARLVAGKFIFPERAIAFRLRCVLGTTMPETTIHENCRARLEKNKVRTHGELMVYLS